MSTFDRTIAKYDYDFPPELIAQTPASPRDSARLLVYDRRTKKAMHDIYKNIAEYLPKNSVLVLNQTKVVPARLTVTKPTGGKARILYISHDKHIIKVLSDRRLEINSIITAANRVAFTVHDKQDQCYILKPLFKMERLFSVLEKYGQTPLPPYIKNPTLAGKKLHKEYNTVFAAHNGSVAAPTASLHFTKALLKKIEKAGITIRYVTLHVNLGTFAPLTLEHIKHKQLHEEYFEIDTKTARVLNQAKAQGLPIVAVGTTVVRTLESASDSTGKLIKLSGNTSIFITEQSKLRFVDQLITNFHVPKSSLLMLVSAFVGRSRLLQIYKEAISKKYRLFSFGDGMYIK